MHGATLFSIIDTSSKVRHAAFAALTAAGHTVEVFYSLEAFVTSKMIHATDVLILGRTPMCLSQSDALFLASRLRPELATFVLECDPIRARQLCQLHELNTEINYDDNPSIRLNALGMALGLTISTTKNALNEE